MYREYRVLAVNEPYPPPDPPPSDGGGGSDDFCKSRGIFLWSMECFEVQYLQSVLSTFQQVDFTGQNVRVLLYPNT